MIELKGKIVRLLDPESGTTSRGTTWEKQKYVLNTCFDKYPKDVMFSVFSQEKIDRMHLQLDEVVIVKCDVESRLFNGKYYTDISAFACSRCDADGNVLDQQGVVPDTAPTGNENSITPKSDTLPF